MPLAPIPICRFRCPVRGHGTTSVLPTFLQRYLHYVAQVVNTVVEACCVGPKELLNLADGPSADTLARWRAELPSLSVRERLLRRLPTNWIRERKDWSNLPEWTCTWKVASAFVQRLKLHIFVTGLLQLQRLSTMKRYYELL